MYFNQVTDKIVAFPSTYVWRMANYGKTHIWGADITLSMGIPLGELFKAHVLGSYTWQKAVDLTDPNAKIIRINCLIRQNIMGTVLSSWKRHG